MTRDGARRRSMAPINAGRVQLAALVTNMGKDARCSGSQPRIARSSPEPPQAAYPSHSIGDGIRVRTVAPKLGQHNAEVFGRIGVTGLEIKARPEKAMGVGQGAESVPGEHVQRC